MRLHPAVLLAGVLVLGACGDTDDTGLGDTSPPIATDGAATEGAATASPTEASSPSGLASADLPDGVAARVGDVEIRTEDVDERVALVREIPEVQEQLQGDNAAQVETQIESEVLGRLVLQRVVLQGAAEEGIEVDDEQVEQDRSQLVEEAGGEEGFAEQLAQAGVPETQLTEELRASIAFELVTDQLLADTDTDADADTGTDAPATATEDATGTEPGADLEAPTAGATAGDQAARAQQEWLVEVVADTDVVVDEQYGAWDPSTGQVVPG